MNQLTNRLNNTVVINISKRFANIPLSNEDLSEGVAISFPILGIKSGFWHYKWKGEDTIIPDYSAQPNARGELPPARYINVVIVKSQKGLTRAFYASPYEDNSNNPPDCWSSDGKRPDPTVQEPINPICETCPNNEWGSGGTAAAPKAKACAQRRRMVLVPYSGAPGADLTNEAGGGPMLLSVPPGSLKNADNYAHWLSDRNVPYNGVVTQLSFNEEAKGQQIVFTFLQALTDEEADVILGLSGIKDQTSPAESVSRILTSRITVDGPDVDDGDDGNAPAPQAPPVARAPVTPAAPRAGSAVKTAQTQAARPAQRTATPQAPAQPAVQPAPAPAPTTVAPTTIAAPTRVGGFAAGAAPTVGLTTVTGKTVAARATQPMALQPTTIAGAVARPATAPASQRVVKQATSTPTPNVAPPPTISAEPADVAIAEEDGGSDLPNELSDAFDDLMNRQ